MAIHVPVVSINASELKLAMIRPKMLLNTLSSSFAAGTMVPKFFSWELSKRPRDGGGITNSAIALQVAAKYSGACAADSGEFRCNAEM